MSPNYFGAPLSTDSSVHQALALAKRAQGDELAALAHLIAAQALEDAPQDAVIIICDVATGYFMKADYDTAQAWYQLVLQLDADCAIAHQNLAAIHQQAGRIDEADASRKRAYALQCVYVEAVASPARRLLILCVGKSIGNVPLETLLATGRNTRIKYMIDYAEEAEDAALPDYDLVFNAIGDADIAAPLLDRLNRFADACKRIVLNPPTAVARTQRHQLPTLLADIANVVIAPCILRTNSATTLDALAQELAQAHISLPALARPVATHGGEGMVRCETLECLHETVSRFQFPYYITAYHDYLSADGYYRKYRVIFIDRQPFPYHLAISTHWMVHYVSSDMENHAWKLAEEKCFLNDMTTALGAPALLALKEIGKTLDLDYAGIDFTLLPDGRVLVFEANATMLVHRERNDGPLAHKNANVERIVTAFENLLTLRQQTTP